MNDSAWLLQMDEALRDVGYAVVPKVLDSAFIETTKAAMRQAKGAIIAEVGTERLERAGELGVLRLMLGFEKHFFRFLEIPEVLAVIDRTVGPTAVMHLQNGFILPSFPEDLCPTVFQNSFHQDFPRYLNGYLASINIFFAIDEFTETNGATWVVPGSHQKPGRPDTSCMQRCAAPMVCPAGSMLVFDSTLWHAAGRNASGRERYAINHQFTRSFIKQQIDYVRALGSRTIEALPPRTQQLLGYYTRVVTSLDEYYQPEEKRLYRKGQG
jgi:ectoine hydroxylase-related dioxygenase (phytanoyl-CoA dioxygenase family)